MFGFDAEDDAASVVKIHELTVLPTSIHIGEDIHFSFRLQFAVDYMKANGRQAPKRFHISENWAYSSIDTNMKLTIRNQADNKMAVDDYVIRWVDMPMMISMPRKS